MLVGAVMWAASQSEVESPFGAGEVTGSSSGNRDSHRTIENTFWIPDDGHGAL
jgi:hypothetical protein